MKKLKVLGTGNALARKCYNTCFCLEMETGCFLIDAGGGNGILMQLERAGLDLFDIRYLFVTHAHTDHILGAVWVIRVIGQQIEQYAGQFIVYGDEKTLSILETLCRLTLKEGIVRLLGRQILLRVVTDRERMKIGGEDFVFFDIQSRDIPQYGFFLRDRTGMTLTFLGDEPYHSHCKEYVQGCDWLLCEAFCLHSEQKIHRPHEKNHSTVKEAALLAEQLAVKNLILSHTDDSYYGLPEQDRKQRFLEEAKEFFSGGLFVPDDLEELLLTV